MKSLLHFLVVVLLALIEAVSRVQSTDSIKFIAPTTDQKVGSSVEVKWDTTFIPKGLNTSDNISSRIRCGPRTQFPGTAVPSVPFSLGKKTIDLPNDSDLIGLTCHVASLDEDNPDIEGISKDFKIIA
ncbi:5145_t:CDS:2 [Acaulospora morrowiae]|uniref:5145_t:CDS:1 n=1 Tax=Acaulospora morrowiae TaxID=94023 RepID=A0A9N8V5L6_9GLOM|nr:5145_t:CDS:2 [Acaulospora morrowiae]